MKKGFSIYHSTTMKEARNDAVIAADASYCYTCGHAKVGRPSSIYCADCGKEAKIRNNVFVSSIGRGAPNYNALRFRSYPLG